MELRPLQSKDHKHILPMIADFYAFHRALVHSQADSQPDLEKAEAALTHWLQLGSVLVVAQAQLVVGFVHVRFGGDDAAWVEDLYLVPAVRGRGLGRQVMMELDQHFQARGVRAAFVAVIPRNKEAIRFYQDCGFDHLNMVELRKNYDQTLDKPDMVDVLGFSLRMF